MFFLPSRHVIDMQKQKIEGFRAIVLSHNWRRIIWLHSGHIAGVAFSVKGIYPPLIIYNLMIFCIIKFIKCFYKSLILFSQSC